MRGSIIALVALALLAGCGADETDSPAARIDRYAAELGTDAQTARQPVGAGATSVAEANDVWDFAYSYPAPAGRIPALRALLDARQTAALAELKDEAIAGRAAADEEGFPFNPYFLKIEWKVVADLPRWLSLSAEIASYQGGAHGNYGFDALLWDREAGKALPVQSLFASPGALDAAVRPAFCAALDRQRELRRGEPVDRTVDDPFNACPALGETTVLLGSSNNRTFDRIGFLIGPYVAGPYAEGSFEVTLPVTRAVKAAARPEYAESFTVTG